MKTHLEKHKFFDSLKTAIAKDPKLGNIDKGQLIQKLKEEGILSEIIHSIPMNPKSSQRDLGQ